MERLIFHIDVNSAFLSWEATYRLHHLGGTLDLREIPSAIGGDVAARHGIILAKSISAGRMGIKTGMPVVQAKQICPELYLAPPNYELYSQCSEAFIEILRRYCPHVEQYSIDEAFMDMSEMQRLYPDPVALAEEIRECVHRELGFTVNVGVSTNKLLAKMASDFRKPNLVHTLFPSEIESKMWPLPVKELFFIGRATAKKLSDMGIRTIGELARTSPAILRGALKKQGDTVWAFANGIDQSPVLETPPPNKGYGNSTTVPFDITDVATAKLVLLGLAETVAARLRENHVKAGVLSVGIKTFDLQYHSHQMVLDNPTNITSELHRYASKLFEESWDGTPIRHLGLHSSQVLDESCSRQLSLFETSNHDKLERFDQTIDEIRRRYGKDSVKRASFLESPIDHLSGGISREKRTVDYTKLDIE